MTNVTPKHVAELVVYTLKPDRLHNFSAMLELVKNTLSQMKGFISYSTYQSDKERGKFMDLVLWDTIENAIDAAKKFQNDSTLKPFMDSFEKITLFEHFLPYKL